MLLMGFNPQKMVKVKTVGAVLDFPANQHSQSCPILLLLSRISW